MYVDGTWVIAHFESFFLNFKIRYQNQTYDIDINFIGHTGNLFKGLQKIFEYRAQTCVMSESKLMLIEFINFRRITLKKKSQQN